MGLERGEVGEQDAQALVAAARGGKPKEDHGGLGDSPLGEDCAEVRVGCDHDSLLALREREDRLVGRCGQPARGDMHGVMARVAQSFCESRRKLVVDEESHARQQAPPSSRDVAEGQLALVDDRGCVAQALADVLGL